MNSKNVASFESGLMLLIFRPEVIAAVGSPNPENDGFVLISIRVLVKLVDEIILKNAWPIKPINFGIRHSLTILRYP